VTATGRLAVLAVLAALAACATRPPPRTANAALISAADATTIYLIRRAWHTDVGFASNDLAPPLATVGRDFPAARYLVFGFGDRRYVLADKRNSLGTAASLWPGPGLVLVTGLTASPQIAFGPSNVIELRVTRPHAQAIAAFVWDSMAPQDGAVKAFAAGPYGGSLFYAAEQRYSAVQTCNTWTAEALRTGGLPFHSTGIALASQVWQQGQAALARAQANPITSPAPSSAR